MKLKQPSNFVKNKIIKKEIKKKKMKKKLTSGLITTLDKYFQLIHIDYVSHSK